MKKREYRREKLSHWNSESGMTLVEIIVALTISAIIGTMAFQFLSMMTDDFAESHQSSEMQQELRWAMKFLSDHVKLAGNGVPPTCGWPMLKSSNGLSGEPDSLIIMGCFKSVNITTTQQWGNAGAQEKLDDTSEIEIGDLAVISDGTYSEVFILTDKTDSHVWHGIYPPWNDSKKLDHRYASGSSLTIVSYYNFYVETNDDGSSNLVLKHQFYGSQILAGNIEDFQLRFQMKNGEWIDEPDSEEIYDIKVIEITIRVKSPKPIPNYVDPVYGDSYKRIELKSQVIPKNITVI